MNEATLNLNLGFAIDDLGKLLASCDDSAGHHIIWVDRDGIVSISLLPDDYSPAGWENLMVGKMKFRYETIVMGNEYVGPKAVRDKKYVEELYNDLINDWDNNRKGYIDK